MKRHFWGISATVFGTWEALSYGTKGKVPTVSKCVWWGMGSKAHPVIRLLVAIYLLGLGRHLMNGKAE